MLHEIVDEFLPNTERYMIAGGDFVKGVVIELREDDKKLKYSPYDYLTRREQEISYPL